MTESPTYMRYARNGEGRLEHVDTVRFVDRKGPDGKLCTHVVLVGKGSNGRCAHSQASNNFHPGGVVSCATRRGSLDGNGRW